MAALALLSPPAHADDEIFALRQPLNHATVRESVPVRVSRDLLNQAGYATIEIDGHFVSAPMVPDSGDVLWTWDTKAPLETADNSDNNIPLSDGDHTITVTLFDKASDEIAQATSTVRVMNHITSLPDGVRLVYKWHQDEIIGYTVQSQMRNLSESNTDPNSTEAGQLIQVVNAHLDRSVENDDGSTILLRDLVTGGQISDGVSNPEDLTNAYNIKSKYFTVDPSGRLVVENTPLEAGDHFSFPLPQFRPNRVNVGDSWQTSIRVSLPWSSEKLSTLYGTARLDSFEWEDGYPCAKIVETYDGPGKFYLPGSGETAALGAIQAPDVHLTRTVWFAYEAGILIRIESSMTSDTQMGSEQYAAISGGGAGGGPEAVAYNSGIPSLGSVARGGGMPPGEMGGPGEPGAPNDINNSVSAPESQGQNSEIKLLSNETMMISGVGD